MTQRLIQVHVRDLVEEFYLSVDWVEKTTIEKFYQAIEKILKYPCFEEI